MLHTSVFFFNSKKNFFDFHDVRVAVNFNVILWFLAEQTVCMYVCKQTKQMHLYSNLYNSIHFYAVYLKINFGLGLRDSKCCQDLRAT